MTSVRSEGETGDLLATTDLQPKDGKLFASGASTKSGGWLQSTCCTAVKSRWRKFMRMTLRVRRQFSELLKPGKRQRKWSEEATNSSNTGLLAPAEKDRLLSARSASARSVASSPSMQHDEQTIKEHFEPSRKPDPDQPTETGSAYDLEYYITLQLYKLQGRSSTGSNLNVS